MIKWTDSQRHAITCRGRDMIVSAGAGSGKTTVLTQRIIEKIEQGASVSDFLVVTFTNASAADLRAKISDALSGLAAAHPDVARYRAQLLLLPTARISTIDSFYLSLVRSDFQTLGLSPRSRIMDAKEEKIRAFEVMDALIGDCFCEGRKEFFLLADTFSDAKNKTPLRNILWEIYEKLRAFANYFAWLEDHEKTLRDDAEKLKDGLYSTSIGEWIREKLTQFYEEFTEAADVFSDQAAMFASGNIEKIADAIKSMLETELAAARGSYEGFLAAVGTAPKIPGISANKMDPEQREWFKTEKKRISDARKNVLETFDCGDTDTLREQFLKTADVLHELCAFLKRFEEAFEKAKRADAVLSFSDTAHGALKLLEKDGQPTPFCLSLRSKIKEIFVDEYQDVSPLQDHVFELLSSGGDRFMVGDVKQSIYRFRNAYPDIFLNYKERFADYREDGTETTARVFLRENFRSGEKVVDFVNLLFSEVTGGTRNQREYEGEELVFYRKTELPAQPVTVAVSLIDPETKDSKVAEERLAKYVAAEITRLVGKADCEDKNGVRKVRYGDVALLFRNLTGKEEIYEKALREQGIPYVLTRRRSLFDQPAVILALALLKTIDDPTDDVSLFAAMRSPAFGFAAEELYGIRLLERRGPLIRAVNKAAERDDALAEKCKAFLRELELYRDLAEGQACHVFLWELLTRTGLLRLCGEDGRTSLLKLYEYARGFESGGYKGLSGLIAWLKVAEERGAGIEDSGDESSAGECVSIGTVHKSKGMEYPVVFLCNCQTEPKKPNAGTPFLLRKDEGLFFPLKDYETLTETNTLLNKFALMKEIESIESEELRLLYVACTRAKDKLYVLGTDEEERYRAGEYRKTAATCFMDHILYATRNGNPCFERIEINDAELLGDRTPAAERSESSAPVFDAETEETLRYSYPYGDAPVPAKVSVSELKKADEKTYVSAYTERQVLVPPAFLASRADDPALRGTANHLFLQFCDFSCVESAGIHAEAERLLAAGFLTREQFDLLDEDGLKRFFESDLYGRMRKSASLYREQRFSVRASAALLGGREDETVLVQGVIDCFFEEEDGTLTVVDYKTDRVFDPAELRARHEPQLAQYRYAVERMTGKRVGKTALWSFAMAREV